MIVRIVRKPVGASQSHEFRRGHGDHPHPGHVAPARRHDRLDLPDLVAERGAALLESVGTTELGDLGWRHDADMRIQLT